MFQRILVAIDGSKSSERALDTAMEMAAVWGAGLELVYVIETGLFSSLPLDNTWEVIYGILRSEGERALSSAKEKADAKGLRVTTHICEGHAGSEILKTAKKVNADLIVVGSHGKSQVDRLLLGSVSSYVVKYSNVTTLVVRG